MKKFEETINGVAFNMKAIPSGTFTMGSPESEVDRDDDEIQHEVSLDGFWMGETQVTQALWMAVMGSNPSYFSGCDNCPVGSVSWDDAQSFISKLNSLTGKQYRLPTEAEWEFACRAGEEGPFHTGNNLTTDQANYDGNYPYNGNAWGTYRGNTTPVGSFAPNAWGLYDMHGNVYEWCNDWYGDYPAGPVSNPKGPGSGGERVIRGGNWYCGARSCRSAYRNYGLPDSMSNHLGFRLAMSL